MDDDLNARVRREELKRQCLESRQAASDLHDWLMPPLAAIAVSKKAYFKNRKKPWFEIQKKVIRKRREGRPDFAVTEVTDVSGFRIVSLFHDELPGIFEAVLDLVDVLRAGKQPGGGL